MSSRALWTGFTLTLALAVFAVQEKVLTPSPGTKERKAIMDSIRLATANNLQKRPVVFKVNHLRVLGEWCFMSGTPLQPNGKPFDYKGTVYEQQITDEIFDDWICALLKKSKGKWKVIDWQIGATDVAWDAWPEEHKAPRKLFPYPD